MFYVFILYRSRFVGDELSISTCGIDPINTIKFVGRQHSLLTGAMDQLNLCYSFQV